MKIQYPSEREIEQSIKEICETGLPHKTTVASFLLDMHRNFGMRHIYMGMCDIVAVSFTIFVIMGYSIAKNLCVNAMRTEQIQMALFAFAPILFMCLSGLCLWKERNSSTFELKQSCKYTAGHLIVYRMIMASFIGFATMTIYVLVLCGLMKLEIIRLLSTTYASLLIFSICMVWIVVKSNGVIPVFTICFAWVGLNMLGSWLWSDIYVGLLQTVPIMIWVCVDCVLALILIKQWKSYLRRVCNACC